jgi:ABC-2 type transport system permease protein/sodium transport system permease protein
VTAVCEEWFFRGYLLGALRGRAPASFAIVATAVVFGLFHASIGSGVILLERVLSSAAMGLVLGWWCWSSQSVLPGIVLHALHNGLMLSLAYWGDGLKSLGLDVQDQQHLPTIWLVAAVLLTVAGLILSYWGRRPNAATLATDQSAMLEQPLPAPVEPHAG